MPVSHHSTVLAQDLDAVFTVPRMSRVWRSSVRNGLRRQPLADLHDFLDVHRNLTLYLRALRSEVLLGRYSPHSPELTLLEKRDGIPRRLALPAPADAILLQTIVQVLETNISSGQPHPNAFYAQSHSPPGPEDVDGTFAYPWWLLWPEFQKRIWKFVSNYPFVVVTDIANYFDCIPLRSLRNRVASLGAFNEPVIDFLFYLLGAFTWRPFYRPSTEVGLPQINFDAPRLLAHCYLFPVDTELQMRTNGDFVRWMDDINCGVVDEDTARRLLRGLETVLNSLGVRLNAGKTKILKAEEAVEHFWIQENRSLTILSNLLEVAVPGSASWQAHHAKAKSMYRRFRNRKRVGHWEKIVKRYLTLFGRLNDPQIIRDCPSYLTDHPGLRGAVLRYYARLGPTRARLTHIATYLTSGRCLDDASLFEVTRTLIAWKGQVRGTRRNAILALITTIQDLGSEAHSDTNMTTAGVTSSLWLFAKYGSPQQIGAFIGSSRKVWTRSPWAARQVAAVTPLLSSSDQQAVRDALVGSGLTEPIRVLASLSQLNQLTSLDPQIRAYLLQVPAHGFPYPLEKAIIGRVVVRSRIASSIRRGLRARLVQIMDDPCYASILRRAV